MSKYKVRCISLCPDEGDWWSCDGEPEVLDREDTFESIRDFLMDAVDAYMHGNLDSQYTGADIEVQVVETGELITLDEFLKLREENDG